MKKTLLTLTTLTLLTSPLHAEYIVSYFDKGQIKAQTNYENGTRTNMREGVKHGLEKVFYQSGQIANEVHYIHGKRDGKMTWYDREGNILSIGYFKLGKYDGLEETYYLNKKIKKRVTYINDLKEGFQKEYFDNGQLASEVKYIKNRREGVQKEYTKDGKLYAKVSYKNNYKEGNKEWYDEKGKVTKKTFFKMDRPIKVMKEVQKTENPHIYDELRALNFSPNRPQD